MNIQIDTARFERIRALTRGSHRSFDDGTCVMEAVSYVAGEKFSDRPKCVCPVLGAFMRTWNDELPTDNDRTRLLRPLIPRLVNTRGGRAVERRRSTMAADWLIRVRAPALLRLATMGEQADALASLAEIRDLAQCHLLMPTLTAVCDDAVDTWYATLNAALNADRNAPWDPAIEHAAAATVDDIAKRLAPEQREISARIVLQHCKEALRAAGFAARDPARDAARDAARYAAKAAVWDPAWDDDTTKALFAALDAARDAGRCAVMNAVWDAAKDAALNAARGATWDAALNAAMDVLKPARGELERSALDLVERMIAATD